MQYESQSDTEFGIPKVVLHVLFSLCDFYKPISQGVFSLLTCNYINHRDVHVMMEMELFKMKMSHCEQIAVHNGRYLCVTDNYEQNGSNAGEMLVESGQKI